MAERVPLEASVVRAIRRWLDEQPDLAYEVRHGSAFGRSGQPDISGCINGRRFEIEVKRPGAKLTLLQWSRLQQWQAAGAVAAVARSLDDAKFIVGIAREEAL